MKRLLQILTIIIWGLILIIWFGDIWLGIPASVGDDVCEGRVSALASDIESAILNRRIISILCLFPALTFFGMIIFSIVKNKVRLFYIGMSLTITPILFFVFFGLIKDSEMPNKNLILLIIGIPLLIALIKGLLEIFRLKKVE